MAWFLDFFRSTVGKKIVMAVTGLILFGFLIVHMLGNLQLFLGPETFNAYSMLLHKMGGMLWVARILLLVSLVLHLWSAYVLWRASTSARPVAYAKWTPDASTYASRTMRYTGPIIGAYVVFHVLHLTVGAGQANFSEYNVYGNVVAGFQNAAVSGSYIVAMLLLTLHLYHGVWSFLQTLGVNHPKYNAIRQKKAIALAFLVGLGFLSIPISVLTGLVR